MSCPDPSQIDRSLDDPEVQAQLAEHLAECGECRGLSVALNELPDLLARPGAWEAGSDCLDEADLLATLNGRPAPAHVSGCAACQADLEALAGVLEQAPRVSSELEARLRQLPQRGRAAPRLELRRGSGRRRRASARRSAHLARPAAPSWAWPTLAAAASILVMLALLLRPGQQEHVAAVPGPTVKRAASPRGAPPQRPAPTVDPSYPLPALSPSQAAAIPTPGPSRAPAASPESLSRDLPPIYDDGGALQVDLARLGGSLERLGPDGWVPFDRGTLESGDKLRAGDAGAFLSLEEGRYEVCLAPGSVSAVRATVDGAILDVERGSLRAEVVSLLPRERFEVVTRQGRFAVLGTIFTVEDHAEEPARLLVSEGTVAARSDAGDGEASAGEALTLEARRGVVAIDYDPSQVAWAEALAPRREPLQAVRFAGEDDRAGFAGDLESGQLRLELLDGDPTWGVGGVSQAWSQEAAHDVYLRVVVTSGRDVTCRVQLRNSTQDKLVQVELALQAGRQRTLTIPVLALTTDYEPARNPVRPGDRLEDLRILAGGPGQAPVVRVDEVTVYRKVYR